VFRLRCQWELKTPLATEGKMEQEFVRGKKRYFSFRNIKTQRRICWVS